MIDKEILDPSKPIVITLEWDTTFFSKKDRKLEPKIDFESESIIKFDLNLSVLEIFLKWRDLLKQEAKKHGNTLK